MTTTTATRQKRCPDCDQTKPHSEYHANTTKPDGVATYCKPCASLRRAAYLRGQPPKPPAPKPKPKPSVAPPIIELAGALRIDPWAGRAACGGKWAILECRDRLPDGRRDENEARVMCAGCPVRNDCREWALALPQREDPDDLWILGGLNRTQRNAMRQRRKKPPKSVPAEKRCTGCKEVKALDEFSSDKRASDGRTSRCLVCIREKNRRYEASLAERATLKRTA